jgi:cystathionine beta-lyase/cystathionine gamma-synthase
LRITNQSSNATELAQWLNQIALTPKGKSFDGVPGGIIKKVWHGSLQDKSKFDPAKQHTGGYSPTFSILVSTGAFLSSKRAEFITGLHNFSTMR